MQADIEYRGGYQTGGIAESVALAMASRIDTGELAIALPHGGERVFVGAKPGPAATLSVHRPRAFRRILLGGTLAFAEAYMDGDCDSPDLAKLVELVVANEKSLLGAINRQRWARLAQRIGHLIRPNSRRGARRNIAKHYDLGNDFYALWLDTSMTYSAGIFDRPETSLATAQDNKYRRMAELAAIGPNDHVLEVGCGWGGFCAWTAREIGCRITAVTISRAQHDYAAARLQRDGLNHLVDLRLQDYRDIDGKFDGIVSIEMLEAVGEQYWPRYFRMLHDRLVPGGRAALQVITIDDALFDSYRRDIDFIRHYIFPGGLLPSPDRLRDQTKGAGLAWRHCNNMGLHYATTLEIWRDMFETAWPQIHELGFDERFRRMWRYYLASCEVGFKTGRIDVLQVALSKS